MRPTPDVADRRRADLAAEQAHIDRAYAVLDRMRGGADGALPEAIEDDDGAGGQFQIRAEREMAEAGARRRVGELQWGDAPLCFGRIDTLENESWHIGRIGVAEGANDPLVVDWRAPIAEAFYRATRVEPMNLHLRRSFHCRGRRLLAIDEVAFDDETLRDEARIGEAALLASLAEARTDRMTDIVATVQSEQDEIIRAPMAGVTVVQGGAGTGKTVVALHRAAYLLYTWRTILEDQGVLVLGPNNAFLSYVRDVLPALGEHNVRLATVDELFPGIDPVPEDPDTAIVKADLRMAKFVARALRIRRRRLRSAAEVPFGRFYLRVEAGRVNAITREAARLDGSHNRLRKVVEDDLLDVFHADLRERIDRATADPARDPGRHGLRAALSRTIEWRRLLDTVWPKLSPEQLLGETWAKPGLVAHCARGLFEPHEWERLVRDHRTWTVADVPLLHEAFGLLGRRRLPKPPDLEVTEDEQFMADRVVQNVRLSMDLRLDPVMEADLRRNVIEEIRLDSGRDLSIDEGPEVPSTWGYILVDEAQDLSPMAWRMVRRACPNQSMTLVGDLAQGTKPWSPSSWDEVATAIAPRRPVKRHELHINYRTPAEIMALAIPFSADPAQATAVRHGASPTVRHIDDAESIEAVAVTSALDLCDELVDGTVAIICANTDCIVVDHDRIRTHTPETAKGLEFDGVVVVEPADIIAEPQGRQLVYIALTRATKALSIVHAHGLPPELVAH